MKKASLILSVFAIVLSVAACNRGELVEIQPGTAPSSFETGRVYVGGEVAVPGIYSLQSGDTLEQLARAAGGFTGEGDPENCLLYFGPCPAEAEQKVDLNRAPAWLLEALPGIGEVTARNIIRFRNNSGPFRHIRQIMMVDGIGQATFENLAARITVAGLPE